MDIVVCIKQVPASSNVKVDPETGVLIRDGANTKMNPYDLYALEAALTLRTREGGTVRVITMGPPAANDVLREALYMGADSGILISDRRLGGADVLATSYTLSSAIKTMGHVDLILCGKQTTDGDTAQVGAEMAEFLGLPQYSNVRSITPVNENVIQVVSELGSTVLTAKIKLPCLLCTDAEINTPRLPSYKLKKQIESGEEPLSQISLDFFEDKDPKHYGLAGSATAVERIFPPDISDDHAVISGTGKEAAAQVLDVLLQKKFL
ncbi:MAG: electron transfer flavoprotein subunit beta/FixA family protein [Lachnospiraceae bacterium]|nr:electron transfer flavoprotein subunit beta/FixA family protein [Lachnospiraceae bacterium]